MKTALLLSCALLPAGLAAQRPVQFVVGGAAAQQMVRSQIGDEKDRFTGLVLGGEGMLVTRGFVARVRYAEGRITHRADELEPRDVVEGEALIGYRVLPWLTLWGGPSARAYTTDDGDQRWLIWSARAAGRGSLLPGRMQTYVEVWGALGGNVATPAMKAGGRGADIGLELRLGGAERSFWGRVGYRIESVHATDLRETVEALTLSLVYGSPL